MFIVFESPRLKKSDLFALITFKPWQWGHLIMGPWNFFPEQYLCPPSPKKNRVKWWQKKMCGMYHEWTWNLCAIAKALVGQMYFDILKELIFPIFLSFLYWAYHSHFYSHRKSHCEISHIWLRFRKAWSFSFSSHHITKFSSEMVHSFYLGSLIAWDESCNGVTSRDW